MATKIANLITLDGTFMDWPAADIVTTPANVAAGYQIYGAFLNDATLGNTYVIGIDATASTDPAIGPGAIVYLNTDQNNTTGYNLSFANIGAEYEVQFSSDATGALQPYLYSVTSAGITTLLNGGMPLDAGFSSNGESVELAIPQALLTPAGGAEPTSVNFATLNGAVGLPGDLANNPEYIITDAAAVVPTTTIGNLITLDGAFSDWPAADIVTTPANVAAGYQIYGAFLNDATLGNTYVIGIDATASTDPAIGPGAIVYLNTDQNNTTGYNLSFANIGAEYEVQFAYGSKAELQPFLYSVTSAGVTTLLNGGAPLHAGFSSNGESVELAIPQALLTPAGGAAPTSINFVTLNGAQGLPPALASSPEYTITDTATLLPKTATHRVAIVYSDTTAALYFRSLGDAAGAPSTAYSDLFMAAQNQARMAGVSYDVIDESQLMNINNLIGYDAIIFPAMADVNTAQLPAIMSTLTSAVYNYHISIITSGDFLTNDQTGAPLPSPYANMETLLGLTRASGGNSGTVTVTASDVNNTIMSGYTTGQHIQTFSNEGYTAYQGVGGVTPDVLVNQNVTDPTLPGGSETIPGVVETTTGGTNVEFSSQDLLGDSNLLSHVIQSVVLGTHPGVALHISRDAGVVAVRMDMDQSQFPSDVSPVDPNTGQPLPGIYDTLIPILQQWNQQYDFVGSYYINIGDNPTAADPSTTNWTVSSPYYQDLLAIGSEIGNHSYTHLINPPTETFTAVTSVDTPAGSTQITLTGPPPSFYGITVGMWLSGTGLGSNTPLPGVLGEGGALANTQVTAVNRNTITVSYVPAGFGGANQGTLGDVPAGTTLTFSIPPENTNFLEAATGGANSATNNPFTYAYEFGQSKTTEQTNLGTTIYGAAVPGAGETYATDQNILPYFQSVAPTATTPGYTGYVTGGWTGIGSGYPSAIGYMSPSATDLGSLYIAPNMTFDFTEIQYEGKTVAEAEAAWAAQFSALTANAAGTPVVVLPIHDYGVAAWNTTTDAPNDPVANPNYYTTQMYASFIANAYADNYEFLTLEELAARTEAQQKAGIDYTTVGNTITVTVTPDPTAPDLGAMALDVVNDGTEVIQNVTNWYAYNAQELFLPRNGGAFVIDLGTTQDDVTHITSLPMRADLVSVIGDGLNLSFSMFGDGQVVIDLKDPTANIVSVQGAPAASLSGDKLVLTFADTLSFPTYAPLQHNVTIDEGTEFSTAGSDIIIGTLGNDFFTAPGGGNDTIIGHGGSDTVMYDGANTDYLVVTNTDGSETVTDLRLGSPDGTDTLFGIANIVYAGPSLLSIVASGAGIIEGAGDLGVGSTVILTVNFNQAMTVAGGIPTLTLNDGGVATYTGGSGTPALTFSYVVAAEQNTADLAISSFDLPAGVTVQNGAGVNASLTAATNYNPIGTLQIDTTAPATPSIPDLATASDTGVSSTDNITKVTKPTFIGTAEAGSTVTLFDGATAVGTGIATDGTWRITSSTLTNGTHSITAQAVDVAGNISAVSAALSVAIDTTAPATPSIPDLATASDTGVSNTDNITKVTKPTFIGTAEAGSTVTLFDGATAVGTGIATDGTWSITSSTLTNGTHSITAQAVDVAGNISAVSAALSVAIDTTAPATPSIPDLATASDTGVSSTDNITKVTKPTFIGTAEAGSTVTLFDGATAVGTGIATDGTWSITSSTLTNGTHSITAQAVDVAGNISAVSAALSVAIDTTAPATPSIPDLATASDTGVSSTDNITKVTKPTFIGTAEAGSTVTLFDGATAVGTGIATSTGTWSVATTSALLDGTHNITATTTDVAGNVSVASGRLSVTVDTLAPSIPASTGLTANNGNTLTITGTGDPSTTVAILTGTTTLGTGTVGTGGAWSMKFSYGNGKSITTLAVVGSDAAGNKSAANGSVLLGSSGADTLTSTAGNDLLYGGSGADNFSFASHFGQDVIADFAVSGSGHDIVSFSANATLNSFANVLSHSMQVGSGVVIRDDLGSTLTLNNVSATRLTAADFRFV